MNFKSKTIKLIKIHLISLIYFDRFVMLNLSDILKYYVLNEKIWIKENAFFNDANILKLLNKIIDKNEQILMKKKLIYFQ